MIDDPLAPTMKAMALSGFVAPTQRMGFHGNEPFLRTLARSSLVFSSFVGWCLELSAGFSRDNIEMKNIEMKNIGMKQILLAVVLSFWSCLSLASPTPAPVRAEIDTLLAMVQSSGCQFDRNGTWYTASATKDHILRKLEHIEGKSTIQSTEQFIELVASKSNSSGKPYHVKCGAEVAIESQQWLKKQLVSLRASSVKGNP